MEWEVNEPNSSPSSSFASLTDAQDMQAALSRRLHWMLWEVCTGWTRPASTSTMAPRQPRLQGHKRTMMVRVCLDCSKLPWAAALCIHSLDFCTQTPLCKIISKKVSWLTYSLNRVGGKTLVDSIRMGNSVCDHIGALPKYFHAKRDASTSFWSIFHQI